MMFFEPREWVGRWIPLCLTFQFQEEFVWLLCKQYAIWSALKVFSFLSPPPPPGCAYYWVLLAESSAAFCIASRMHVFMRLITASAVYGLCQKRSHFALWGNGWSKFQKNSQHRCVREEQDQKSPKATAHCSTLFLLFISAATFWAEALHQTSQMAS